LYTHVIELFKLVLLAYDIACTPSEYNIVTSNITRP